MIKPDEEADKYKKLVETYGSDKAQQIVFLAAALHKETQSRIRGIKNTS